MMRVVNKWFIAATAATVAFSACTSGGDEPPVPEGRPVKFSASVESASRSIVTAADFAAEGSAFRVWATMHSVESPSDVSIDFNGTTITSDGKGAWTYPETRFWIPKQTYNFRALYPASVEGVTFTKGTGDNASLTVAGFDVRSGIDLMAASIRREIGEAWIGDVTLPLGFRHLLTRVSFRGRSDESMLGRGRRVIVTSAAIYGLAATGTWTGDGKESSWTPGEPMGSADEPIYKVEFPDGLELSTEGTDLFSGDDVILAIPQIIPLEARLVITCHYNVSGAHNFVFEAPFSTESAQAEWKAGSSLRYPFTVASGVFFSVPDVVDWNEIQVDSPDYKIE